MQQLRYSVYLKSIFIALDLIGVVFFYAFFYFTTFGKSLETFIIIGILTAFIWFLISGITRIYNIPRNFTLIRYGERLILHFLVFFPSFYFLLKIGGSAQPDFWKTSLSIFIFLLFLKPLLFLALKYYRKSGKNIRNIMLIGQGDSLSMLKEILKKREDFGYKVFPFHQEKFDLNELQKFWTENGIHSIFIPLNHNFSEDLYSKILEAAETFGVSVSMVPERIFDGLQKYQVEYFDVLPVLKVVETPLSEPANLFIKNLFDLVFSLVVLVAVGIWLVPIIALAIIINSRGPVFFLQKRYGYQNKVFNCIKFRTMVLNEERDSKTTLQNDKRITRVGRFLRKTSLDEFPQFFNVLIGQMSVVGPRPHMMFVEEHYKSFIQKYNLRNTVKPGITGLAQIRGYRGDRENMDWEMKKRIKVDLFYINNWTFTLDLVILIKTFALVLLGDKKAH